MGSVSGNNTTPLSPVLLQNEIRTSEFDALRSSTPSPSSPTLHVGPRGTTRITRGRCRLARPYPVEDLQLLSFASFPGALRLGSSAVVRHNALMLQHCLRKQTLCRRDCGPLGAQQLTSGRGQCGEIDSRRAVDRSHPADQYDLAFDLNPGCRMLTLLPRLKRSIVMKPWAAECEPGDTSRSRDTSFSNGRERRGCSPTGDPGRPKSGS